MAATSLDALEALLQFRGAASNKGTRPSPVPSSRSMPVVPNPLDPLQPHVIEGDAPTPVVDRQEAFGDGPMSAFSTSPPPADVSSVPNPLATPFQRPLPPRPGPPPLSACKPSVPAQIKIAAHGFGMHQSAIPTPSPRDDAHEVEISSDKILSALHSKPQRGKKRQNLSDLERQELTRTRNREHARSTRMKKKARFQELVDIEQKYLLLKQKETLDHRRREQLVSFVENAGLEAKACPHSSRLVRLASRKLRRPEFAVAGAVALTTQDSGIVKVSVGGEDESGEAKTLTGVIGVDFGPSTADICAASLHWSSFESTASSAGMFPSVSVLSFET